MLFSMRVVAVARNVVQFPERSQRTCVRTAMHGTEEQCRAIVIAIALGQHGFECPVCGGRHICVVTTRDLYQCAKCTPTDIADRRDDLCIDPSAAAGYGFAPSIT